MGIVTSVGLMAKLQIRNLFTRKRITGDVPVTVSLTSYGVRTRFVHLAIESIASGEVLPQRIILWLDEREQIERPGRSLERLKRRGLEIRATENYGPHKKYFPYVMSQEDHQVPLVTSDDDVIYPRDWLTTIWNASTEHPDQVIANRTRRIRVDSNGLCPYSAWDLAQKGSSSVSNFATGVGGVLYPPPMLNDLRRDGDAFLTVCPRADDVWLHVHALRSGRKVHQTTPDFRIVPLRGTGPGLFEENVDESGNDRQIAATYTINDVLLLQREAGIV